MNRSYMNAGSFVRADGSQGRPQEPPRRPGAPPGHSETPLPKRPPHVTPGPPPPKRPPGPEGLLSSILPGNLDAGDILLFLILFFLYSESGDEDFLIILAVVAFSILKK